MEPYWMDGLKPISTPVQRDTLWLCDDGPTNDHAPETDARGFPWDERIHSATKAIKLDGTWRYKRNTDPKLIDRVEEELKGEPSPPEIVKKMESDYYNFTRSLPPAPKETAPFPASYSTPGPAPFLPPISGNAPCPQVPSLPFPISIQYAATAAALRREADRLDNLASAWAHAEANYADPSIAMREAGWIK